MLRSATVSAVSSLVMLMLAAPLMGSAQQLKPNELATNLPGVTTFAAPPQGFDPLTASDQDLAEYGFPPRPDQATSAKAFASWTKAMAASKSRIAAPKLALTNIFHGPAKMQANAPKTGSDLYYSGNWSGYVNLNGVTSYNANSFYFIIADYVVPVANQAFGVCTGRWDYESSWVGIDGFYSSDVLQAGTESDAFCSGSTRATYYSPWFEWYPYGETRITNLPIAPGDDYFVEVWSTTSTTGHAYLVNENTDQYVDLTFYAPSGTKLIGNSAEWVVERPSVGGSLANLTNYIADVFWDSEAFTFNYAESYPGNSQPIDMYNGGVISYPTLLNSTTFLMQDSGSAY